MIDLHNDERGYAINDEIEKFNSDDWVKVEEEADSEMQCDGALCSGLVWSAVRLKVVIDCMVSAGAFKHVTDPDDAAALQEFLRQVNQADVLREKYAIQLVEERWQQAKDDRDEARGESYRDDERERAWGDA